jgi:hypothetical protein
MPCDMATILRTGIGVLGGMVVCGALACGGRVDSEPPPEDARTRLEPGDLDAMIDSPFEPGDLDGGRSLDSDPPGETPDACTPSGGGPGGTCTGTVNYPCGLPFVIDGGMPSRSECETLCAPTGASPMYRWHSCDINKAYGVWIRVDCQCCVGC